MGERKSSDFGWTFIADVPNPAGEDFHLWACDLCGAVVPGTHERVHLVTHGIKIPFTIDREG
jgi:hypothetical protein